MRRYAEIDRNMKEIMKVIKAISEETRLRLLNIIIRAETELCICEIEKILNNIAEYNISKHIKYLKEAKLVKERKDGRFVFYSIDKQDDKFHDSIINLILSIPDDFFQDDNKALSDKIKSTSCCEKINYEKQN